MVWGCIPAAGPCQPSIIFQMLSSIMNLKLQSLSMLRYFVERVKKKKILFFCANLGLTFFYRPRNRLQ